MKNEKNLFSNNYLNINFLCQILLIFYVFNQLGLQTHTFLNDKDCHAFAFFNFHDFSRFSRPICIFPGYSWKKIFLKLFSYPFVLKHQNNFFLIFLNWQKIYIFYNFKKFSAFKLNFLTFPYFSLTKKFPNLSLTAVKNLEKFP